MQTNSCKDCGKSFPIDDVDQAFYAKMGVPLPSLCPDDRQRRRLSYRNERNLYHRKCDLCNKQIVSIYHADSPYKVYCNTCWWSDKWDPLHYGRELDFSRPIFDQLHELQLEVPRLALYQKNNENSDFTNHTEKSRNCYLCIDTAEAENVYYSKWIIRCRDSTDSYNIENAELCYECQYQVKGYQNLYTFFSDLSQYSSFTYGCVSCQNCFMCFNLNRKQYCIRNQQFSKEAYEAAMAQIDLGSHSVLEVLKKEYVEMIQKAPKRAGLLIFSEDSDGDCLYQCKNVKDSFDVINSQDSRYCYDAGHLKDCYDVYESAFDAELQYECHGCNRSQFLIGGHVSYDVSDSCYVDSCHNSQNIFACVGLRNQKYYILNRHYSQDEFHVLREKLIAHMKQTGEWGEFMPIAHSPFAYNESLAQEYFPMSRENALQKGYRWKEENAAETYQGPPSLLPDRLADTPDSITDSILRCEVSGKLYKIIPQELALYRKLGIVLPRRAPQQRYLDRLALRNPRTLWPWDCSRCGTSIRAPYLPGSQESVYCQSCFTQAFYA